MPVSIQSNVWFDDLHFSDLPGILEQVARAGYDGVEIGAHKLNLAAPHNFSELLTRHGLTASGIHIHGEIYTPAEIRAKHAFYEQAIQFAVQVKAGCVLMSGRPKAQIKDEADLLAEVDSLRWLARICASHKIPLYYHTHNWELLDDLRELRYLVANTDPGEFSLALDIGWVKRAGYQPLDVIDEFYPRIAYLHLKDTLADRWTEIGRGMVDFATVISDLKQRRFDGWLTVERDEALPDAFESAKTSRDALRALGV